MKKLLSLARIISILLIFGMALAGCDDGNNLTGVDNEANSSTAVTAETGRAAAAKPSTPSSPKVTATTPNSITISWSPVTGATGYRVYRNSSSSGTYSSLGTVSSPTCTYTDKNLKANTTYYYKVSAYNNSAGEGNQSSYVKGKTGTLSKPGTPAPRVTATTPNSVSIAWSSVTGAADYKVYRSTSSGSGYTLVKTTPYTTFTDTGLKANTTYYYKIAAHNDAGDSNQSSYVQGKTLTLTKPATPSAPKVTTTTSTSITISWPYVTGAADYKVYRSTSSGSGYTLIKTWPSTTFTDTGLKANTTYYYKVAAHNDAGDSSQSSYAQGKTLK